MGNVLTWGARGENPVPAFVSRPWTLDRGPWTRSWRTPSAPSANAILDPTTPGPASRPQVSTGSETSRKISHTAPAVHEPPSLWNDEQDETQRIEAPPS